MNFQTQLQCFKPHPCGRGFWCGFWVWAWWFRWYWHWAKQESKRRRLVSPVQNGSPGTSPLNRVYNQTQGPKLKRNSFVPECSPMSTEQTELQLVFWGLISRSIGDLVLILAVAESVCLGECRDKTCGPSPGKVRWPETENELVAAQWTINSY